jgi:peptide/nickel transport system substrate-binding protein
MRQRFFMVLVALTAALSLSACGGKSESKSSGVATDKNTLVIAFKASPTNIDSRVGNDNASGRVFDLIYSGLIKVTPDLDYAPDVAEKWEIAPDNKTITFHLNPKAKFQNGQPVLAKDVKWTYDSMLDPNFVTSKRSGYASLDHIEAPDDHTVIFRLKEPNGGFFDNLTVGILPTGANTAVYKTKPIGAGPYKVVQFLTDERVELEAFDGWHGGAPKIKHVVIRIIPDTTTIVLELKKGSVNFEVNQIAFDSVKQFENDPNFKVVKKAGSVYQYLAFNLHDPILSKQPVREALAYAIDRERLVRDQLRGFGKPTETMFGEGHWARADLPLRPYDPNKAKQLLDAAGYKDPDGDGPKSRFKLSYKTSNDAEANQRAEMIQQMFKEIGVDAQIQSNEFGTFYEDIGKGNFQMFSLSRNGIQDPDFYYTIFHSKNMPPGGQNRGFYSNTQVDQWIEEGRSTFDRARRKQIYGQIQQTLAHDLPYVSLYNQMNVAVMRSNIDGYVMYPAGFLLSVPQMEIH